MQFTSERWSDPTVRAILLERLDEYLEWLEAQVDGDDHEAVIRTSYVVARLRGE